MAFRSEWLNWKPETSRTGTDNTDKSPSVGFVSSSGVRFRPQEAGKRTPLAGATVHRPAPDSPSGRTDKTDKSPGDVVGRWAADPGMVDLVRWFMATEPPPRPFDLERGVTVARPDIWWRFMRADIAAGPRGPRAHYGAVQSDLRKLHGLMVGMGTANG